jgi:Xaa-Pro aminopeptidase
MSTSSERPTTLRARLKKKTHAVARMRKAIQKAAPGVAQTAEALRRKGLTVADTLRDTFMN